MAYAGESPDEGHPEFCATCSAPRSSTTSAVRPRTTGARSSYSFATDRLRATGRSADQVETVLCRIVASGAPGKIDWRRDDGVVRPSSTAGATRPRPTAWPRGSTSGATRQPGSKRGLIREEILPLLRRLHPAAEGNLLRLADRSRAPRAHPPARIDRWLDEVGPGSRAPDRPRVRTRVARRSRVALGREVRWGEWRITSDEQGLGYADGDLETG